MCFETVEFPSYDDLVLEVSLSIRNIYIVMCIIYYLYSNMCPDVSPSLI